MTDERLCIHLVRKRLTSAWVPCGHAESAHVVTRWNTGDSHFVDNGEEHEGIVCVDCGNAARSSHPFEAAPSTDEGEAQEQEAAQVEFDALTKSRRPEGAYSDFDYKRFSVEAWLQVGLKPIGRLRALQALIEYEAAIRASLEERIRALQTINYRCEEMCEAAQYGGSCRCSHLSNDDHGVFRVEDWDRCPHRRCIETRALLATPPSSTEGTE